MKNNKFILFSLIHIISIFRVSLLETVHFTNSPNKILKANNFTTYKVGVPNGDPITIIEGNSPLIDKKIQFNEIPETPITSKFSINQIQNQQRGNSQTLDLKTSLSMTVTPNDYKNSYENMQTASSGIGEESVANINRDYNNLSPEQYHNSQQQQQNIKTVYSPELLEKFLKDYANKIHGSASIQLPIDSQSIEKIKNPLEHVGHNKYESMETSDNDYHHNNGAEEEEDNEDEGESNRRVSSNIDDSAGLNDIQERKHYRPSGPSGYGSSGYGGSNSNKNNGWVTLEAVPWSKSKISKWQSYAKPQNSLYSSSNYNYQTGPSSSGGGSYNRPNKPTFPYDIDEHHDNNYNQQRPGRPTFANNQFFVTGIPSKPNNGDRYSIHSHSSSYDNGGDRYEQRPGNSGRPEIITDNRPSTFPQHSSENHYNRPNHHHHHRPSVESYDRPSRPFNDYQFSSYGNGNKDGPHPVTYPNSGADGEWILISTTKGYQHAKRHGQRAMLFKAQNGFQNDDNKKGGNNGIITAAESRPHEVAIKPPRNHHYHHSSGPTKLMNQQTKLTVLPLYVSDESYQSNSAASVGAGGGSSTMEVNTSVYKPSNYNGIIEADPSQQTIEESVAAAAHANEQNAVAVNSQKPTKKKVRKHNKNFTIMRKNSGSDSASVLAAVGEI